MNCKKVKNLFLETESAEGIKGPADEHIARCEQCRGTGDIVRELRQAGETARMTDMSERVVRETMRRAAGIIEDNTRVGNVSIMPVWRIKIAVSAAMALLILMGFYQGLQMWPMKRVEREKGSDIAARMDVLFYQMHDKLGRYADRDEIDPLWLKGDMLKMRISACTAFVANELSMLSVDELDSSEHGMEDVNEVEI